MKVEIRVQPDSGSHNVSHNVNLHPLGGTSPRLPGGVLPTLGDTRPQIFKDNGTAKVFFATFLQSCALVPKRKQGSQW